jgi:hypothetical protein
MFYRLKAGRLWREIDLRPLSEIPGDIITRATTNSLRWDVLAWGLVDPTQIAVLDAAPMRLIRDLYDEWQKDSGIGVDEICQLLALIDKHSEALEADLIDKGLRLRDCPTPAFNWRDLWVLVRHSSRNSHIVGAANPDVAYWDHHAMLQAAMIDSLNWLVWAKTEKAAKGGDPPDPLVRPGVEPKPVRAGSKVKPMTLSKLREHAGLHGPTTDDDEDRQRKIAAAFTK